MITIQNLYIYQWVKQPFTKWLKDVHSLSVTSKSLIKTPAPISDRYVFAPLGNFKTCMTQKNMSDIPKNLKYEKVTKLTKLL